MRRPDSVRIGRPAESVNVTTPSASDTVTLRFEVESVAVEAVDLSVHRGAGGVAGPTITHESTRGSRTFENRTRTIASALTWMRKNPPATGTTMPSVRRSMGGAAWVRVDASPTRTNKRKIGYARRFTGSRYTTSDVRRRGRAHRPDSASRTP